MGETLEQRIEKAADEARRTWLSTADTIAPWEVVNDADKADWRNVVTARSAVLDAIEEVTGERPTDAVPLAELVDSFGRLEIACAIDEALGVELPMDAEFAWTTVGDVVAAAERLVRGGRA